jgi:hypothetical protein
MIRNFLLNSVLLLLLLTVIPCSAKTPLSVLVERRNHDLKTPEGKAYEMTAVSAFWGDAKFMRTCSPVGSPIPEPHSIFVEIMPNGKMGELVITPNTPFATCIMRNVQNREFPKPPGNFVLNIELKVTE